MIHESLMETDELIEDGLDLLRDKTRPSSKPRRWGQSQLRGWLR